MSKKAKSTQLGPGLNSCIRLKDLDQATLFRSIQEIEEFDKVHYRRTCGPYQQPKQRKKTRDESDSASSFASSEESFDYLQLQPYEPGSLGLIGIRKKKERFPRPPSAKKNGSKGKCFDRISAIILSELRLINKFEKKDDKDLVKIQPIVREKRRYYVPK